MSVTVEGSCSLFLTLATGNALVERVERLYREGTFGNQRRLVIRQQEDNFSKT